MNRIFTILFLTLPVLVNGQLYFEFSQKGNIVKTHVVGETPIIKIESEDSICKNEIITTEASSGNEIYWSNGEVGTSANYLIRSDTIIWASVSNEFGCTDTAFHSIKALPIPDKPILQINGTELTSSVDGDRYEWYLDGNLIPNSDFKTWSALKSGLYKVVVYNEHDCMNESVEVFITVTSVVDHDQITSYQVFPNPANDVLHIQVEFHRPLSDLEIKVFDSQGKLINVYSPTGGVKIDRVIPTSELSSGTYYLKLSTGRQVIISQKINKI